LKSPEAVAAFAAGNALRREGRIDEAVAAFRRAIELDPANGNGHYNLGIALRQRGDLRGAAIAFRDAARIDPKDVDAVQNAVETLGMAVDGGGPALFAAPQAAPARPGGPVSIVVCSIDPRRLAAMQGNFRQALGDRAHEFVVIRDARSLCEGYQRGLEASRHDRVVFAHDDVELASAHPFEALERALHDHDIVGVAGSRLVNGPGVTWAGHPHLHGGVAYPPQGPGLAWKATLYSLEQGVLGGMQALDGLLLAARREAALRVGFDAVTFDGFHFYDVDFTYRAHLAGLRVAVATDVLAIHASVGQFDEAWKRYAERFRAKYPALDAPLGRHFFFGRDFATRERMLGFYAELRGLALA
jgi:tetratricopeptide (TPR) repeat protein